MIVPLSAQKLVIGSRVPDFKGAQWLSSAPQEKRPMLIEFYNPTNPTCNKFFPKLANIKKQHGDKVQIIVLTAQTGPEIDKLVDDWGRDYSIGYDPTGKIYQNFNVRFLPFTLIINSNSEIFWQGNLGNLPSDILGKVR